jgi:DNA-binding response OmpR family regulator
VAIVGYLVPSGAQKQAAARKQTGVMVDRDRHQVLVDGREVVLLFQEFELLEFLTAHPGQVFSREQILASAWPTRPQATSRTVDVHIHRLRRKLGTRYGRCLITIRSVGYAFRPLDRP